MKKSKNTSKKTFIVGSSSVLAKCLSEVFDDPVFFGRSNPFNFSNWTEIGSLSEQKGIDNARKALNRSLDESVNHEDAHLVLLQGVSSTNWTESININFVSVAELAEEFATWLERHNKRGSVTMIGSAAAILGGKPQYSSTKAALVGVMNSLTRNYSPSLRANLVLPGVFKGSMVADWDEEKIKKISQKTFAQRFAEPVEIADAIKFAIHNDYVSGSIINMTNGQVN